MSTGFCSLSDEHIGPDVQSLVCLIEIGDLDDQWHSQQAEAPQLETTATSSPPADPSNRRQCDPRSDAATDTPKPSIWRGTGRRPPLQEAAHMERSVWDRTRRIRVVSR